MEQLRRGWHTPRRRVSRLSASQGSLGTYRSKPALRSRSPGSRPRARRADVPCPTTRPLQWAACRPTPSPPSPPLGEVDAALAPSWVARRRVDGAGHRYGHRLFPAWISPTVRRCWPSSTPAIAWHRLGSEYAALDYLAQRGISGAPLPLLRDDEHLFGVYSFEEGERRAPAALGQRTRSPRRGSRPSLRAFPPGPVGDLALATAACFAHADQVRLIEWRLRAFEADAYAEVRDLQSTRDLRATVERLVAAAIDRLTADDVARPIPRPAWRLNTYDFGPHNWLFRADGGLTVVDFEGAGRDDPARMVMGCISHPGSDGLRPTPPRRSWARTPRRVRSPTTRSRATSGSAGSTTSNGRRSTPTPLPPRPSSRSGSGCPASTWRPTWRPASPTSGSGWSAPSAATATCSRRRG